MQKKIYFKFSNDCSLTMFSCILSSLEGLAENWWFFASSHYSIILCNGGRFSHLVFTRHKNKDSSSAKMESDESLKFFFSLCEFLNHSWNTSPFTSWCHNQYRRRKYNDRRHKLSDKQTVVNTCTAFIWALYPTNAIFCNISLYWAIR